MMAKQQKICPHFGVCGGCSRQDQPYDAQLKEKQATVQKELDGLGVETFHDIRPSPETFFYRNRMEFSFGDARDVAILNLPKRQKGPAGRAEQRKKIAEAKSIPPGKNRVHLGLHPKGRFNLVTPTPECRLMSEESQKILGIVSAWATKNRISTFTRHNNEGVLRHFVVREGKNTGERMVNLFSKSNLEHADDLARRLKKKSLAITTFLWTKNDGLSDVARGSEAKIFWGDGLIHERFGSVTLRVPPESFMQTNTHAAERLIDILSRWIDDDRGSGAFVDFYCGCGMLGLNVARRFEKGWGVDLNEDSIREARKNAADNGVHNVSFLVGRAEDQLDLLDTVPDRRHATLLLDPPRAGLQKKVAEAVSRSGYPNVYYVSCNPASLGDDLRILRSKYKILDVQPMDFFPHTDHVETAVRLKK